MRSRIFTCLLAAALTLTLGGVSRGAAADASPGVVELYFEAKLLLRDRVLMQRVAVDQWAGGRLALAARPMGPGTIFELLRPLEHPWTFRWYPTKHEVKLGAAVAVAEPLGDPYGALAEELTLQARRRYEQWWTADVVESSAPQEPAWQDRAERFWATRHAAEVDDKDPLHPHPVFPFHVLGDPAGRFGFVVGADGGVIADSVTERMSNPWLADGWAAWQRGEHRSGYGYWEPERPAWEPNTYQAFAAALALLGWSPLAGADPTATRALDRGAAYSLTAPDLPRLVARFFETLNPRFEGHIDWSGTPTLRFTVVDKAQGALTVVGDSADAPVKNEPKVSYRAWRYARYDETALRLTHDEVQVFAAHQNAGIKVWIRIGYRPAPG